MSRSDWQVLLGGTLIDGTGRAPVRDAAVVIEGGRIRYAGPRGAAEYPADASVQVVDGLTVMPGLIDCHDHLAHPGLDLNARANKPHNYTVYETGRVLEQTLLAGITTVRDAGGLDYGAKLAVDHGLVPGPNLVVSLAILCPTAGLGDPCCPAGLVFADAPGLPSGVRNGVDGCRQGVRDMVAAGAGAIKIATTGGVGSRWHGALDRQFTDAEVSAIVDEAHAWGRRVLCHAHGGVGVRTAVRAGVDSLDHGSFLHQDEDVLREMADRGIFMVPTLSIVETHLARGNPEHRRKADGLMEHCHRSIRRARELGVRLAMGTDVGAYHHGRNAHELALLVEAGLTPMDAIVMSTGAAAACLGLDADLGTLEAGKAADLLVVDGDPLADITVLEQPARIRQVRKGGTVYLDRSRGNADHPRSG